MQDAAIGLGHCKVLFGNRKCIQIVDDDPAICDALKFQLELEGHVVRTHRSGVSLLSDCLLAAADCLVLDCRMPEMDGFDVLIELDRRSVKAPVIMITAPVSETLRRRAKEKGVLVLLEKPLLDNVLLIAVREAMSA